MRTAQAVYEIEDEDVHTHAGLDALVLQRLALLGIRVCCACIVPAAILMCAESAAASLGRGWRTPYT